jgi:hypothetical protein
MASLEALESLAGALRSGIALAWREDSTLQGVLYNWLEKYDRGEHAREPVEAPVANDMHVVGACVCVLLGRSPQLQGAYDLRGVLGALYSRMIFVEKRLEVYDLEDLQALVTAVQLEFPAMYEYTVGEGYSARCDVEGLCVRVLARLGEWLAVRWKYESSAPLEMNMPPEALRGLAVVDADGFCRVRLDAVVFLLDALHSVLGLHRLLMRARARDDAEAAARIVVSSHHLEASSETFFTQSMTADCVVGTVAQYAHKFSYLFHSISQTVYYNRPSYIRQRQIPLARLLEPTTAQGGPKAVNLLALLVELAPDIPVLFEHTGAGHRETHARHRWAWVLWLHFVLLVDADMHVFAALDARALAALCEGASPTRDVTTFLYLTAVLACTPVFFYLRRRSFAR